MIIAIKAGRFNIIHTGHVHCLNECKSHCDKLIVLLHDKEEDRAIMTAEQRSFVLKNLRCVDEVFIYTEPTEDNIVKQIRNIYPNDKLIIFHDEGLANKQSIPASDIVDEIFFIPRYKGLSVSDIYERIRNQT